MSGAVQAPIAPMARRTVTEVIRRGLDNAIANWPILLIRMAETIVIGFLAIVSAIAVIVPMLVSLGLSNFRVDNPENAAEILRAALIDHWIILLYMAVAISVFLVVIVAVHSFVIAGAARIFVEGEQRAGRAPASRQQFAAFSVDGWMAGGRQAWWRVFWIYNIAYGVAGIVVLLPLLPVAALILIFQASPVAVVVSCLALVAGAFFSMVVLVVTNVVCQKAIILVAGGTMDASASLRLGWRAMRADFGRHFGVAFIMIVLAVGGSGLVGALSLGFSAPGVSAPLALTIFLPVRLVLSFVSSVFSAAVSNWFLGSFAALTAEEG